MSPANCARRARGKEVGGLLVRSSSCRWSVQAKSEQALPALIERGLSFAPLRSDWRGRITFHAAQIGGDN